LLGHQASLVPSVLSFRRGTREGYNSSRDDEEMGTGWFFNRDKTSLDIFWLRGESLKEFDNLPDPDVLAQEIVEDLEAALEQFREIANDLDGRRKMKRKFSVFHLRRFS
jgi:hypothetical protein